MVFHSLDHALGIVLVVLGQLLRSTAMIHAASNFSHAVAFEKASGHKLVVDGIYAWVSIMIVKSRSHESL